MRHISLIFPCELFLAFAAGWFLGVLPQSAMLLETLIPIDGLGLQAAYSESLRKHPTLCAVNIVAEIESIRDPWNLLRDVEPGDVLTGTYIFDSNVRDSETSSTSGNYQFSIAPSGVTLQVGSHRFGTDQRDIDFNISVENLDAGNLFSFVSRNNISQPALGNDACTGKVNLIWWSLHDLTGTALSSDKLPAGSLELANWQSIVGLRIEGTVTDLSSKSEVPLLITAKVIHTETIVP